VNLGTTIRNLRQKKGYKQKVFADAIGISPTSLSLIETGTRQPSDQTLKDICRVLRVPQPFIYFLALEKNDIPKERVGLYKKMVPRLQKQIEKIFLPG
jgi:transcriptional regulator with XRE-family HTH domain